VQFHYAERDANIPMSAVDKVRTAMHDLSAPGRSQALSPERGSAQGHMTAEVHVYPGAQHGFNCWARGSYHAASAALAHGRSLQFLSANLF